MRLAAALLLVACGRPLEVGTRAADCGTCHAAQHDAWSTSSHAKSGASDVFRALLPRVETAWGPVARARCETCHTPRHSEDEGITCVSCHSAVGNRGEHDGQVVVDLNAPLAGPTAPATAPHAVTRRGLLSSASLCITCHEVTGPGVFDEPTGSEFRASGAEDAACAQCHLEGHRFEGLALLEKALKVEASLSGEVAVTNVGAAHSVPTGIALLRDIWVDVDFELADGGTVQVPRVLELGSRLSHAGMPVALPTEADAVTSRALKAKERRVVQLAVPPGARGVQAHVRSRAIRADVLEALGP